MKNNRGQDSGDRGQLRPCPFCGNKEIGMYGTESDFIYKDGTPMTGTFYYAECEHCGCSLGPAPSEEMLIENWNRRAERMKGEWIEDDYGFYRCSECGFEWDEPEMVSRFCPHCGAKMECKNENAG